VTQELIQPEMSLKQKSNPARNRERIFVVDDQPLMRIAVTDWINRTDDLELCGEADSTEQALKVLERVRPNLVLTEIVQPQDFSFIRSLHRRHHRLPILVFSFRDEGWYAPRALAAGACGYLMKNVGGAGLLAGIHDALNGHLVISPEIKARLGRKSSRAASREGDTVKRANSGGTIAIRPTGAKKADHRAVGQNSLNLALKASRSPTNCRLQGKGQCESHGRYEFTDN